MCCTLLMAVPMVRTLAFSSCGHFLALRPFSCDAVNRRGVSGGLAVLRAESEKLSR